MATKKVKKAVKKIAKRKTPTTERTIKVIGKFGGPVNNNVILKVFRTKSLPNPFNFEKTFTSDFTESIDGLKPGLLYHILFSGHTPTQFDLEISGDFDTPTPPIKSTENGGFTPKFAIKTTK
jgi:hypothetical protein